MLWVVVALVVVAGIVIALFGWDRYGRSRAAAGDGSPAQPTAEVFVDPETGRRMRVWYQRDTGRREYRPEERSDAALEAEVLAVGPETDQADRQHAALPVDAGRQPAAPRLGHVAALVPPATDGGGDMSAAIEATGLTKRFGETVAVEGLSFSVTAGRIVGFLGPNGAGKTTTMRMLLGLVRPTAGSATIDGRRYSELEHPAQTVGALLDGDDLHPGRSGRNHLRVLARAAGVARARVDELLELVDLTDAADRRAGSYSMGMRQRLGLAAALLGDPQVLVLDEPANGLDPQGIRWLRDFLRSLAGEGRSILVSSHVLAEISHTADEVVVINHGRSVLQAPLAELMAQRNGGMRVAGPDTVRLAELLRSDGAQVEGAGDGAIVVADRTGEQIGRMIAANGIVISELAARGESLEDVFFELTGSAGGPS
ncbi:MAG: ABC transporter ATP-binding protein [Solirubrobacteraceae bacterium]